MTIQELIEELKTYPPDLMVTVDGFAEPTFDMATIADFDVPASRRAGAIIKDISTERRVLVICPGNEERIRIDVNGYSNSQPHFITYDSDGIQRS